MEKDNCDIEDYQNDCRSMPKKKIVKVHILVMTVLPPVWLCLLQCNQCVPFLISYHIDIENLTDSDMEGYFWLFPSKVFALFFFLVNCLNALVK